MFPRDGDPLAELYEMRCDGQVKTGESGEGQKSEGEKVMSNDHSLEVTR